MIEETATSGYDCTEEIPVMEVSILQGGDRRSRDTDFTNSGASKRRRRFGCEDEEDVFQLQYRSRRDVDVNFHENDSHHVNSLVNGVYSMHDDSISDLKVECVTETDVFFSKIDGFSTRETSTSSVVCLQSEEMESSSTTTVQNTKPTATAIEATSRRKLPPVPETMPSAAELEEFFSKAEKYEQKRFAEKYNFDIVKDVPMEGRYQWIPLPLSLPLKP